MGEYSLSECYYSSPCAWIEETRHRWAKNSLASDIDFALSCFDRGAFGIEDFFSTRGRKWLRRAESSFFSDPFGAAELKPYALTERVAEIKRTTPFSTTIRRVRSATAEGWDSFGERAEKIEFFRGREDCLHELADRVAALEAGFDNLFDAKATRNQKFCKKEWKSESGRRGEFVYSYSAKRVADPLPWFGKFSACQAETYALPRVSEPQTRVIPVEDGEGDERSNLARSKKIQNVFARKRAAAVELKGKRKELSPQDAALIIQARFREHLVHRSQALRGLRELAVAKARLKELRTLFSNYAYRRHLSRDPEERQRFSEKIIVVLLTVDSVPGLDYMVRDARRSMIQELESMLDAVDPQASNKAGCGRRKFDLPEPGTVHKEMAMEVSEVVGMLDEKNEGNVFPYVTV